MASISCFVQHNLQISIDYFEIRGKTTAHFQSCVTSSFMEM